MLTLDLLQCEPMYQEFDACFTGRFKRTLTDIRCLLTVDDHDLTEAVSLVRDCWDDFQALYVLMASGMAEFISDTYTGTHEPRELEQDFHRFIVLILDAMEHGAKARYRSERRCLDYEKADEAQRVLMWISEVRTILAAKTRLSATTK